MPNNKPKTDRREYLRNYQRKYQQDHPEKVLKNRLATATHLLMRHGYMVSAPDESKEA